MTPAQVALACLLAQDSSIVPIPGARSASCLQENTEAAALQLDGEDLRHLNSLFFVGAAAGHRYPEIFQSALDG